LHLVDDSIVTAKTFYLLDLSSVTKAFIFLMVDQGYVPTPKLCRC